MVWLHCRIWVTVMALGAVLIQGLLAQGQRPDGAAQAQFGVSQAQRDDYRGAIQSYKRAIAIDRLVPISSVPIRPTGTTAAC